VISEFHNPESHWGRGNGPEARPGAKRSGCSPKPVNRLKGNPRPSGLGGGQLERIDVTTYVKLKI